MIKLIYYHYKKLLALEDLPKWLEMLRKKGAKKKQAFASTKAIVKTTMELTSSWKLLIYHIDTESNLNKHTAHSAKLWP